MKPALAVLLAAGVGVASLAAAEDGWSTDWHGTLYGYVNSMRPRSDSVLNPNNAVAKLAERSAVAELRLNLKAENETIRLTARPIVSLRRTDNDFATESKHSDSDAWFSQWQLRVRASEGWHVALGRDLLTWGPAQFRSPSNPFYFDNGRSDPLRELTGVDSLKVSWTPDRQTSVSLVRIVSQTGSAGTERAGDWRSAWRNGWLLKLDQRGDAWAYGLVAARSPQQANFFGAHAQTTLSDAVLLYGEAGSSERALALVEKDAPRATRRTTALLGSSYTFENNQSLAVEYLRNGHGYTAAQEDSYFDQAETSPGRALATQPPLLGRDYVHLVWQTNLMDNDGYWRAMYSRNLTDDSGEFAIYADRPLNDHVTAYVLAVVPHSGARREFSDLFTNSVTVGVKIALP